MWLFSQYMDNVNSCIIVNFHFSKSAFKTTIDQHKILGRFKGKIKNG